MSSGTGGNASAPNSTPLSPAPLQKTTGSSHPPLGQTEAGGGQSTEQAGGGQSTEQAGGGTEQAGGGQSTEQAGGGQSTEQARGGQSTEQAGGRQSTEQAGGGQSTEQAGGGQSTEQAGGGQSTEQVGGSQSTEQAGGGQSTEQAGGGQSTEKAGGGQSAESFAPTPAHDTTAVTKEGAGASETGEDQDDSNMSKNPAESLVDSGIEKSRDDASSNAQTSAQKESETGDDRRSLGRTTLSSLSVDRKSEPHHGPPTDRPTSPGATSKNSGSGASSQDPSNVFSGRLEARGGAAMNKRRLAIASRKARGVKKPHSGTSGSSGSRKSFVSVGSSPTSTSISSPATVVPATPTTALGPRDLQDGGGEGQY